MRFCRFNGDRLGLLERGAVLDVTAALDSIPPWKWPPLPGDPLVVSLAAIAAAAVQLTATASRRPLDSVTLHSPITAPTKIMAAPANYKLHVELDTKDPGIDMACMQTRCWVSSGPWTSTACSSRRSRRSPAPRKGWRWCFRSAAPIMRSNLPSARPAGTSAARTRWATSPATPSGSERFIEAGGHYRNQAHVEKIVVEGGKATGVTLADGTLLGATQFVASTVDVHQTFEAMVGREQLPADYLAKMDRFRYTPWTLFGVHFALQESPNFTAFAFDPDLNRAQKWNVGAESIAELMSAHEDVKNRRVPHVIQFGSGALSLNDPTQAPKGKHTAYAWHVMPREPDIGNASFEDFEAEFTEKISEPFAKYAPNMTRKNILKTRTYTARQYTQELINMRSGDIFMGTLSADKVMDKHWGYRSAIRNLYMSGSATHPGGGISGGAGHISAGVIAKDRRRALVDARRCACRVRSGRVVSAAHGSTILMPVHRDKFYGGDCHAVTTGVDTQARGRFLSRSWSRCTPPSSSTRRSPIRGLARRPSRSSNSCTTERQI